MSPSEAWLPALLILADYSPPAYWRMSNGAEFWCIPDRSQLLGKRFAREPFTHSEILSICVFNHIQIGRQSWSCDWEAVRHSLLAIPSLLVAELNDVPLPPAFLADRAIRLTAKENQAGPQDDLPG